MTFLNSKSYHTYVGNTKVHSLTKESTDSQTDESIEKNLCVGCFPERMEKCVLAALNRQRSCVLIPIRSSSSRTYQLRKTNTTTFSPSQVDTSNTLAVSSTRSFLSTASTMPPKSEVPLTYQAWRVDVKPDGSYKGSETTLQTCDLPPGDVLIKVSHSKLNYKDALSASGNRGVTKNYPHTPGIDAAGVVVATGDEVLVTGYDLGMNTDGGFGEYIRVPSSSWVAPMPSGWDTKTSMVYGTSGLTAGLCVQKLLLNGASKDDGPVLVTGASGAVGSIAVEILSKLGFEVIAVSSKDSAMLTALGAKSVVPRSELDATKKPLLKPSYSHGIDTVGGSPLAELLKRIRPGGSVACCGLVAGYQLETTMLPFILRGVNLLGVDSVEIPMQEKLQVWQKLATEWSCPVTESQVTEIGRQDLDKYLKRFLSGTSSGQIVLCHENMNNGENNHPSSSL